VCVCICVCVNWVSGNWNSLSSVVCVSTRSHCVLIRKLEKRIDATLQHKRFRRYGAFVRLSSRSPKDGQPLDGKSGLENYRNEFKNLKAMADKKNGYGDNANTKMLAIFKSQQPSWCIGSGKEALSLLLTSERVFIDLICAISCQTAANDKWSTNVIIRAWHPHLDESYEFRCFVFNGTLTAHTHTHTCHTHTHTDNTHYTGGTSTSNIRCSALRRNCRFK